MGDERKGLSAPAIKSHIKDVFHDDVVARLFNKALKILVSGSNVTKKKGHYKMTKDQKTNKDKIAKNKAAREKTKKTVKKAATKKKQPGSKAKKQANKPKKVKKAAKKPAKKQTKTKKKTNVKKT